MRNDLARPLCGETREKIWNFGRFGKQSSSAYIVYADRSELLAFCYLGLTLYTLITMYTSVYSVARYIELRKTLTALAVIAVFACLLTIYALSKCMHAYGKGLKPRLTVSRNAYEFEMQHHLLTSVNRRD